MWDEYSSFISVSLTSLQNVIPTVSWVRLKTKALKNYLRFIWTISGSAGIWSQARAFTHTHTPTQEAE